MPMATPTAAARPGPRPEPGAPNPEEAGEDGRGGADEGAVDRNEVRLTGRVSGPPERRALPSGDEVVRFRLVVRRDDGASDTVPIQVGPAPGPGGRRRPGQSGRRALAGAERLRPGSRVAVHGRLRRRWWEAGGARRSRLEVVADEVVGADVAAGDEG
jgi:single-strand DNA-binding protein